MTEQTAYRIIDMDARSPRTLFHGINRNRYIMVNRWVQADRKMVIDGGNQTPYLSGFNVLLNREDCEKYLERFTAPRDLRVVEILVRGELRPKEQSRSPVYLADEMFLRWPQ